MANQSVGKQRTAVRESEAAAANQEPLWEWPSLVQTEGSLCEVCNI